MRTKKAAVVDAAAIEQKTQKKVYLKAAPLSSARSKLLAEIRNLFWLFHNPHLSPPEKETYKLLFRSTIRKLGVLQSKAEGSGL